MSIKKFKPITPGQRFKIANKFEKLTSNKNKPCKLLLAKTIKTGGRNNQGKMTMRYRGGGHKRRYRIIDYKRNKYGIKGVVKSIEYDPNRSSYISLVYYQDGEKRYIISPEGIKLGQGIISGVKTPVLLGNAMLLKNIPLGTTISCIEMYPKQGAILVRGAGSYAQVLSKNQNKVNIKLPSGEVRAIFENCMATVGAVSNTDHKMVISGKAGRERWLGRRSRTRGVAMNPVDHPMGGGEGKASGGQPRSRKGVMSKGFKTRKKNKLSNKFIIEYRKK
jgi:large subunit ribosomal protein L2